jgi:hypothetical protein
LISLLGKDTSCCISIIMMLGWWFDGIVLSA